MTDTLAASIFQQVEELWKESKIWPEFTDVLFRVLAPDNESVSPGEVGRSQWIRLPGLSCQAAGGDPSWADPLAVAWQLFSLGAHLMDSVEDEDEPEARWAHLSPGVLLNAATGLFFSAAKSLEKLYELPQTQAVARLAAVEFYDSFLVMASGQHADLSRPEMDLQQRWKVAGAKSGEFFALACRGGARLAGSSAERSAHFAAYGWHFGILVQMLDDLEELKSLSEGGFHGRPEQLLASLPVTYALDVFPQRDRGQLNHLVAAISTDPAVGKAILDLVNSSGAPLYFLAEMERHRSEALAALAAAEAALPANEVLAAYVNALGR